MTVLFAEVEAVTLDFYDTLVYHKAGSGRGAMLMRYLAEHGLEYDPWEHQVLYDVFERHGEEYSPDLAEDAKRDYLVRFTTRVFQLLNVTVPNGGPADHAMSVWRILGPSSLRVFPDVVPVLQTLRGAGYPLALISNWQCGLSHFCTELGLRDLLDHVIVSAEQGSQKPDSEIFLQACRCLGISPHRVLHVGDTVVDDILGAHDAGMPAVLVRRDSGVIAEDAPVIAGLHELPGLLGVPDSQAHDA